jgi:hypothetical protein
MVLMPKSTVPLLLFIACLAFCVFCATPAEAQFQDDPGDTCLCPNDPFCACGGGSGGSGGSSGGTTSGSCQKCGTRWETRPNQEPQQYEVCESTTDTGNWQKECKIQPSGVCELFGDACTIVVV